MRERLTELLPLVLVGVVLLVFQLTRGSGPDQHSVTLQDRPLAASTPGPPPIAVPATVTPRARTPVASPTPGAGACSASRPSFVGGLAGLKASLGASMGEPLECERAVDDQGDTQQRTTTGLAYYRQQVNVASFTTGWDHWGLQEGSLVHWTGDSVDPPNDASPVSR